MPFYIFAIDFRNFTLGLAIFYNLPSKLFVHLWLGQLSYFAVLQFNDFLWQELSFGIIFDLTA